MLFIRRCKTNDGRKYFDVLLGVSWGGGERNLLCINLYSDL